MEKKISCSRIGRLTVKKAILLKLIYKLNTTPIKIPLSFVIEIDKLMLRFIYKCNGPRIVSTIFKKNKVGRLIHKIHNLPKSYNN